MEMFYYEYALEVYDPDENEMVMRQGVVAAHDMAEAMRLAADYYGEDCIADVHKLFCCSDVSLYEFNGPENSYRVDVCEEDDCK